MSPGWWQQPALARLDVCDTGARDRGSLPPVAGFAAKFRVSTGALASTSVSPLELPRLSVGLLPEAVAGQPPEWAPASCLCQGSVAWGAGEVEVPSVSCLRVEIQTLTQR